MNQSKDENVNSRNPGGETSKNSGMVLKKFKKGGSAGSKGVDFQVGLLSVALLNAFKHLKQWSLSTENDDAGKFDDLVLECPDGDILLQAKQIENRQKTVTLKDFMSTDPKGKFSLPKYFGSYIQDIKNKFNTISIIICTNVDVEDKLKGYLELVDDFSKNILNYPGATCSFYRCKHTIAEELKNIMPTYYQNQSKGKYNANQITDENIKEFLDKLQVCCNYPSGEDMEKAIEQVLFRITKYSKSPYGKVSQLEIYTKVKEWFQRKGKVHYLNEILTKAMFFDIWKEKYFQKLKQYDVSFESNVPRALESKGIFHYVTDGTHLAEELRLFDKLKLLEKNVLYLPSNVNTEIREGITEVFKLNQYKILLIVFPKTSDSSAMIVSESVQHIVSESEDKRVILLSPSLPQSIQCQKIEFASIFKQLSRSSQQELLDKEIVNFQGHDVTLKALFGSTAPNHVDEIGSESLDKLIRNKEIRVGLEITPLEPYYINREFTRHRVVHTEDSISEIPEKVILISEAAGYGKTTVLKKLASVIKEKYPHLWIIKIKLNEYTHKFKDLKSQKQKNVDIAQLLQFNDVEKLVFSIGEKVVLMMDAVDEISPDYTNIIVNLLRRCRQAPNFKKIFVTTRPHVTKELKEVMEVDGLFKLQPFTLKNQIEFLTKYWAHNLKLTDDDQVKCCEQYSMLLLRKMTLRTESYFRNSVAIIPLQVKMLGEIFQENDARNNLQNWQGCKEYLCDNEEPELPEMDIAHLYEMFIKKRDIFINKGNPGGHPAANDALNRDFNKLLAYHENFASQLIFGNTVCQLFTEYRIFDENKNGLVLKIGIIQKTGNTMTFVHRTFAEYFAAKRLLDELKKSNKSDELHKYFTKDILGGYGFVIVRALIENFLNSTEYSLLANIFSLDVPIRDDLIHMLAKEGHLNILNLLFKQLDFEESSGNKITVSRGLGCPINERSECLKSLFRKTGLDIKDLNGRTPLHYAAKYGHLKLTLLLMKRGADIYSSDINGDTPLHKAVFGGNLQIVQLLIDKKVNVNNLNKFDRSPLHHACSRGHINVAKLLIQNGAYINSSDINGDTPLHEAANGGNLEIVQYLIDKKVDVNSLNKNKQSPLYYAFSRVHIKVAELLIQNGADINSSDINGDTPLHEAAKGGNLEIVQYLIDKKVDLNSLNKHKRSPLYYACSRGHIKVAELLVQNGDLNNSDINGDTSLHEAAKGGNSEIVQYLIDKKVEVNSLNKLKQSPLHNACRRGYINVVELLIQNGANINSSDINGDTALHEAAYGGNLEIVKYLLDRKLNVNSLNKHKRPPLCYACSRSHIKVAELLIQNGADLNNSDINGDNPLHEAAEGGNLEIVQYLIDKKVDVNSLNKNKQSPLHNACSRGHIKVAELLIQNGADINSSDINGDTPLHEAAYAGNLEIVQYLIDKKVDVNSLNKNRQSPLYYAYSRVHIKVAELLIQNGADINSSDINGDAPLHEAAKGGNLEIVQYLIDKKVDVNSLNKNKQSPLYYACSRGHIKVAELLIQNGADINSSDNMAIPRFTRLPTEAI